MKVEGGQVFLGNNKPCTIVGIGNVRIKTHDGIERILAEIRHILELKRNLISLGMLDQHGYTYKCYDGFLKVSKGSMTIMEGIRSNGLYTLQASTVIGVAAILTDPKLSKAQLWTRSLGHVS